MAHSPNSLKTLIENFFSFADDVSRAKNLKALSAMLGPAARGLLLQPGKRGEHLVMPVQGTGHFDWNYTRNQPEFAQLYEAAKRSQWESNQQLPWSISVDPQNPERELFPDSELPLQDIPIYRSLPEAKKREHRHAVMSWMLSQFLHGEQGALFAACQVTQAVPWMDGKLYGSTQVVDEGRHVEVFHRYLTEKLGKLYTINDNLYVIIDALMTDSRWDIKFLGMQIMIEGLALGAFGTLRTTTREPLLQELLKYVILDEGRHVHYGVLALKKFYTEELSEKERAEREDWAFEVAVLLKNRFLMHEVYDEYYAPFMTRKQWNRIILESKYMDRFRDRMFKRLVPNLKKIGLLTDRVRKHYDALGLIHWESEKAATEVKTEELLG